MKIQIFKTKKKFKKENFTINVGFYWKLILLMTFALVISSFVFGFYLFRQIKKEPVSLAGDMSGKIEIVKKERIDKVLEYFSEREKKSADILNSPSPVVDPSL